MNNINLEDIPEPINDQMIIDLSNQLKKKYDQIVKLEKKLKMENLNLKKDLMTCYGMIRIIDIITQQLDHHIEISYELNILIATLKFFCNDIIDKKIFSYAKQSDQQEQQEESDDD